MDERALPPAQSLSTPHTADTPTSTGETAQRSKQHRQSRSNRREWTAQWVTDWWAVELACWAISVLALVAIVITLETYKNNPVPQWSFGLTLNTLISIFSTIAQMAITKPTVECISQLKWLWFMQRRKLLELQAFDDASRGPLGSLLLLTRLHGRRLVCLGAAITIVTTAFGPFTQQVVTYPLLLHLSGTAFTPQVFNYTGASITGEWPAPNVIASVYEGLALGSSSLSTVTPSCSTGNCTWSEYTSLGMCGSVVDLSSTLQSHTCNTTLFGEIFQQLNQTNPGYQCFNYSLPEVVVSAPAGEGLQILNASLTNGATDGEFGPNTMPVLTLSPAYSNSSSLVTFYLIYQPDFRNSINVSLPSPVAYELNLDLCTQTYSTSVSNGLVNTTLVSSQILQTELGFAFTQNNNSYFYIANDTYVTVKGNVYGISKESLATVNDAIQNIMEGVCYETLDFTNEGIGESFCNTSPGIQFLNAFNSTDPFRNITNLWHNLETSMTNTFRTAAGENTTGAGGDTAMRQFEGKAFIPIAFVEIDYRWLILPIGLITLTLVFLLATIWRSQRLGSRIWKSSNLATLQGLHSDLHSQLGGLSSISRMDERAKDIKVSFDVKSGKAEERVEYRLLESKQNAHWRV